MRTNSNNTTNTNTLINNYYYVVNPNNEFVFGDGGVVSA